MMATATATEIMPTTALQVADMTLRAEEMDIAEDDIQTEIEYLIKDPKHEHEKPYHILYDTGGVVPNTNMTYEKRPVTIHNFRPLQSSRGFETYGFSLQQIDCALTAAEFDNEQSVEQKYYPAIEKLLWQEFPNAAEIKILEHALRKRHAQYPAVDEESIDIAQPATLVHIDFSSQSATRTASAAFKIKPDQYQRLLTVNFWKSFQGPGNDWPLALCDWRTIDYKTGAIAGDVVFHNRFTENQKLYYSPDHQWYYIKDLSDDEVIMMRQTDSELEGGGGTGHTSFYNPKANKDAAPRASIELRAFIFFT